MIPFPDRGMTAQGFDLTKSYYHNRLQVRGLAHGIECGLIDHLTALPGVLGCFLDHHIHPHHRLQSVLLVQRFRLFHSM